MSIPFDSKMTFISLFAGIGGFDLGLKRAGMQCVAQVEIDPFCLQILTKHWPDVLKYGDIHNVGRHNLPTADLICGGTPCQPFSVAGQR
jgi:DNA (cytosine-5)-methyltransferase 1